MFFFYLTLPITPSKGLYCRHCDIESEICSECGTSCAETWSVHNIDGNIIQVCWDCRDENYRRCQECGEYYSFDDMTHIGDGDYVCQDCLEEHFIAFATNATNIILATILGTPLIVLVTKCIFATIAAMLCTFCAIVVKNLFTKTEFAQYTVTIVNLAYAEIASTNITPYAKNATNIIPMM